MTDGTNEAARPAQGRAARVCAHPDCGASLDDRPRHTRFCSPVCRERCRSARRKGTPLLPVRSWRPCKRSGCDAPVPPANGKRRYCSPDCRRRSVNDRNAAKAKARREASGPRLCGHCGASIDHKGPKARYCDAQCGRLANLEKRTQQGRAAYRRARTQRLAALRDRYANDPEYRRSLLDRNLRRAYGLSLGQFEQMNRDRNGLCDICRRPERQLDRYGQLRRLSVDHDHAKDKGEPGFVRGLLCGGCNFQVAAVDKPVWRALAEAYLALPAPVLTGFAREEWLASSRTYRDHGITEGQYRELLAACGGRCQICDKVPAVRGGKPPRLVIDHDHARVKGEPGYVRGLLCDRCNTCLGTLERLDWMVLADKYLARTAQYLPPVVTQGEDVADGSDGEAGAA